MKYLLHLFYQPIFLKCKSIHQSISRSTHIGKTCPEQQYNRTMIKTAADLMRTRALDTMSGLAYPRGQYGKYGAIFKQVIDSGHYEWPSLKRVKVCICIYVSFQQKTTLFKVSLMSIPSNTKT